MSSGDELGWKEPHADCLPGEVCKETCACEGPEEWVSSERLDAFGTKMARLRAVARLAEEVLEVDCPPHALRLNAALAKLEPGDLE